MHFSQQHGYNNDGGGIYAPLGSTNQHYLLRDEINKLCLNCHDGQSFAPDVYGVNTGSHNRQAGALNKKTDAGPYYPQDGHTLGATTDPPGGTWKPDAVHGLTCVDCHHQHGSAGRGFPDTLGGGTGMYRNLRSSAGGVSGHWVTYRVGTNDLTKDVFQKTTGPGVAAHYEVANVEFNEPDQTKSAYGAWCQGCHTDFHGSSADANMRDPLADPGEGWFRHPTGDVNIGAIGGGHSSLTQFKGNAFRTQVMNNHEDRGTQGSPWTAAPADLTPSCFSCHKAHGNMNAFGLIYARGDAALTEEGNTGADARSLCRQCHVQGADP
jgi:hypothetical protein